MGAVRVKRIYDTPERSDGRRILVDRVWPRGIRKEAAEVHLWLKEVAPSTELRQWYGHVPERFDEFAARYRQELRQPEQADALRRLRELAREGDVTLLTATRDSEHSQAAVLADLLS